MRPPRTLLVTILFVSSYAWANSTTNFNRSALNALPDNMALLGVQPSTLSAMQGASFALTINVSGVTDLRAFQFDIKFNPNVLSATSIVEGSFLSSAGSTFFIPGTIGNGIIANTADTLIGPGPGASGSGTLAIIYFSALKPGTSPINLSNVFLLNSGGGKINFSIQGGKVAVGGSVVPEPQSLSLLLIGLLGILLVRGWRGQRSTQISPGCNP